MPKAGFAKTGTRVVTPAKGKIFQIWRFVIGGVAESGQAVADYLSQAGTADFRLVDSSRFSRVYRVHINHVPLLDAGSGVAGIVAGTLNQTARNKMYNDFRFETAVVEDVSLDDRPSCEDVPTNILRSIRQISGSKE